MAARLLRPFRIGDQMVIGEAEGDVERIERRATRMRTYDGCVVLACRRPGRNADMRPAF